MKLKELEIKIQLDSQEHFQKVFRLCEKLFGKPISHQLQRDDYYDTSEGKLKNQDLVIRIRTQGNTKTIALKSPRIMSSSGMSERIELEFAAANGHEVQEQLFKQGLKAHESSEKERWTFVYEDFEIVLDKLPFIGFFMEIEGPSEEEIQELLKKLNLQSARVITKNYGELMFEKFQELKLSTVNIKATFAEEEKSAKNLQSSH